MWIGFVIGLFVGVCMGVFLMCLLQMARDPFDVEGCTGDCDQGRNCTCVMGLRAMKEADFDMAHGINEVHP
jgi:hypothetical protein